MRAGLSIAVRLLALGWVWWAAAAVAQAPRSLAQDAPARRRAAPAETPQNVGDTLAKVVSAYRAGPIADRVVLRVTRARAEAEGSAAAVVRVDAASRRVRLELGPLTVSADGAVLAAVARGDPDRAAVWELGAPWTPADLGLLPPLLLPHPALAFGADAALSEPLPGVSGVVWTSAAGFIGPGGRRTVELRGAGPWGDVRLTIDPATHRISKLALDWRGPGDLTRYELSLTPVEPGDPGAWPIALESRVRVGGLAELAPRTTLMPKGSAVLEAFPLRDAEGGAWGEADFAPDTLVLLAVRAGEEADALGGRPDELAGLVAIAEAASRAAAPVVVRLAAVFEAGSFSREVVRRLDAEWSPALAMIEGEPAAVAPSVVLWSGAGERFFNALHPGADAAIVVVRGDGGLAGVVALNGRGADGEALRAEVSRLLEAARR
jgi:hypothetical protein